ncbi:hypothetical protein [Paenibacillus sp. FSL H7-0331]|uniref:hypothetical protein n=1 Tax=Paenibacillus sp. FSL H7-0331 TaxID=1920421 RepID=UPI0015C3AA96|nr:hypothetical protein [Paenibacillus sp. FSL H7-0331]
MLHDVGPVVHNRLGGTAASHTDVEEQPFRVEMASKSMVVWIGDYMHGYEGFHE